MTVRLRPHHLLCLLTYVGKGYSPAFTANYDAIAGRIAAGEPILVVEGPDDICRPLLDGPDPHCRRASVVMRDGLAAQDIGALLGRTIEAGASMVLDAPRLRGMRDAFGAGTTRAACAGCEWHDLCTTVARESFKGALVPTG